VFDFINAVADRYPDTRAMAVKRGEDYTVSVS
jgi:hypothetical protein